MEQCMTSENRATNIYKKLTNWNQSRKLCWQMSDGSWALTLPVDESRFITCHATFAAARVLQDSKLIYKHKNSNDYHTEMKSEEFRKWFLSNLLCMWLKSGTVEQPKLPIHCFGQGSSCPHNKDKLQHGSAVPEKYEQT